MATKRVAPSAPATVRPPAAVAIRQPMCGTAAPASDGAGGVGPVGDHPMERPLALAPLAGPNANNLSEKCIE